MIGNITVCHLIWSGGSMCRLNNSCPRFEPWGTSHVHMSTCPMWILLCGWGRRSWMVEPSVLKMADDLKVEVWSFKSFKRTSLSVGSCIWEPLILCHQSAEALITPSHTSALRTSNIFSNPVKPCSLTGVSWYHYNVYMVTVGLFVQNIWYSFTQKLYHLENSVFWSFCRHCWHF